MNTSPSSVLSQLGVPYDWPGAQPDQVLRDCQTLVAAALVGFYVTPAYHTAGITSASFDPRVTTALSSGTAAVQAAIQTGHPETVHQAVDSLNTWHAVAGIAAYGPPSDLDILSFDQGTVGSLLRRLRGLSVPPVVLTDPYGAKVLIDAAEAAPEPARPAPVNLSVAAPAGFSLPDGTVIPAADGSRWIYRTTPFGNILIKVLG